VLQLQADEQTIAKEVAQRVATMADNQQEAGTAAEAEAALTRDGMKERRNIDG
jgi:hypothetical protein